jgi:nitrogen fixation-related uncharacterized protein
MHADNYCWILIVVRMNDDIGLMCINLLAFLWAARGFQYKSDLLAAAATSDIPSHDNTNGGTSPYQHNVDDDRSRLRAGGYGASDDE